MRIQRLTTTGIALASAAILATPAAAQCPGVDDSFEDNDDCATAVAMAIGNYTGLHVDKADEDFYAITVNDQETVTVVITFDAAVDTDLQLIADDCVTVLDSSASVTGSETVTFSNTSGAAVTVNARAFVWSGAADDCNDYDMDISTQAVTPCGSDDAMEDNDDCLSAIAMTAGTTTALHVDKADEDFWAITVNNGEVVTVDITFDPTVDVDLQLIADDCVTILDTSASVSGAEQVTWANATGAAVTVNARVYVWSGASADCNDYDMTISTAADPCASGVDDSFEDNDDCASAVAGPSGLTTGLFVSKADGDYYTYTIADGATMDAYVSFIHATADVDIFLWDVAGCDTGAGGALAFSWTTDDDESISYTNLTGADLDVIFHVQVWSGSGGDCNNYDMDIQGVGGGTGNIGTNYCGPANVHSGGLAGVIEAIGSTDVLDNDVTLMSSDLPAGQFAMYINSMNQGFITPPGSSGNLCVGPAGIGRYRFDIQNTGAAGVAMLVLDLTNTPTPGGPVAIQAGETWNFQTWFRDLGGTSNFSDAIEITFN